MSAQNPEPTNETTPTDTYSSSLMKCLTANLNPEALEIIESLCCLQRSDSTSVFQHIDEKAAAMENEGLVAKEDFLNRACNHARRLITRAVKQETLLEAFVDAEKLELGKPLEGTAAASWLYASKDEFAIQTLDGEERDKCLEELQKMLNRLKHMQGRYSIAIEQQGVTSQMDL